MADVQIGETADLFKLFVGQIPKEMDEISLRQYFEEFGPIVEVSIIRDNATMLSKGEPTSIFFRIFPGETVPRNQIHGTIFCVPFVLITLLFHFRLRVCDVLVRALCPDGYGQVA